MNQMIEKYIQNLTKEDIKAFAIKNNVYLNSQELDFTHQFVKKNWQEILKNPNQLHLERYKNQFSEENYLKIQNLIPLYLKKYASFLSFF